ncbi:MAG: hypothetical protein HZB71_09505 [Betaproteobacteria bacterium]|nr:hypothetical protein [Betaproteobacteria bacterium]
MLAFRLLIVLAGVLLVVSLLGYSLNRDPRWLRFAGLSLKGALGLIALLMLVYALERLVIAL